MTYHVIKASNSINNTTDNVPLAALTLGLGDNLLVLADGYLLATGANSDALYVNGYATDSVVTVNGLIYGTSNGIYSLGDNAYITVNGQVMGDGTAISISNGGTVYVSTTGLVSGGFEGMFLGDSTLINNGTVQGSGNDAIQFASGKIINTGLIQADYSAISFSAFGTGYIKNSGTIMGGLLSNGSGDPANDATIENSGLWSGSLGLTAGDDTVTNTGEITGGVSLGDGNDQLDSRYGFIGEGIDGGAGSDWILAGDEDNTISGGAGSDILDGGGGVNTVDYASSTARVRVDLLNGTASRGDAGGDTLLHFQNVTGTLYADRLTGDNGDNVLSGILGNDVLVGNNGNDTLMMWGGPGLYSLNGGAGNDVFQLTSFAPGTYGDALVAGSKIIGGTGFDTMELTNIVDAVTFTASTVTGVERIVTRDGYNYTLTTHNATVAAGQTLEVDASGLTGTKSLTFNGAAENDGKFDISGGAGKDTLVAGAGADVLFGGGNGDTLTGGAGGDIFEYDSFLDSVFATRDSITDLVAASDKIRLDVGVTGMDASVSGSVTSGANLQTVVGANLLAHHAIIADVTGGALAGQKLLVIDANGTGGYQAGADYVINVTGLTGTLAVSNFLAG
jgi:hypothetical protein